MNEDMQAFFEDQGMTSEQIAEMQEEYAEDVSGTARRGSSSAGATGTALATLIALPFALLWWLLYSPIALVAAALSQSFMATLNPVTGIDAIRRMGSIYWEARTVRADVIGYGYWPPSRTGITRMLSSRSILFVSSIGVTCGRSRAVPGPLSTERAPPPRRPQVTPPPSTSAD